MKTKSLHELSSNQYWGGLNKRFDKRVRQLSRAHFRYSFDHRGWPTVRTTWDRAHNKLIPVWVLTPAHVMHADGRAWVELLKALRD